MDTESITTVFYHTLNDVFTCTEFRKHHNRDFPCTTYGEGNQQERAYNSAVINYFAYIYECAQAKWAKDGLVWSGRVVSQPRSRSQMSLSPSSKDGLRTPLRRKRIMDGLQDKFQAPDECFRWFCPPDPVVGRVSVIQSESSVGNWSGPFLRVFPNRKTDFWQRTHYSNYRMNNASMLYCEVPNGQDFSITTCVRWDPKSQFDQAGLCVHFSEDCWIKTSVEFETTGNSRLGSVVTNDGYSDWATSEWDEQRPRILWYRIQRKSEPAFCYVIEFAFPVEGKEPDIADESQLVWNQMRIAHLREDRDLRAKVGIYACSPVEEGFCADFAFLKVSTV